jgi:hypothetical protein
MSATAELEHLLTIPPANFHQPHNSIAVAHANLELLRDSGDTHYLFLRTIFETVNNLAKEELLFHCVAGFRQVVVWHWRQRFSPAFLTLVRNYLMHLGHALAHSRACRLACYAASVAIWKRAWNESPNGVYEDGTNSAHNNNGTNNPIHDELAKHMAATTTQTTLDLQTPQALFQYLHNLFQGQPLLASTYLTCLIQEFAGKSAVSYRMPLEFHKLAHAAFERDWLFVCLQWNMLNVRAVVDQIAAQGSVIPEHAQSSIQLVLDVVGWEFGHCAWDPTLLGASGGLHRTLLRPPAQWRECLASADIVAAICNVHPIVVRRNESTLAHSIRQLLLQFASLSGPMFATNDEKLCFASYLMQGTLGLLNEYKTQDDPSYLLDTLQLLTRIINNFRLALLVQLPTLVPLLQRVTAIGMQLLHDQTRECEEQSGNVNDLFEREWREEVLRLVLECGVLLCGDPWLLYSGTDEARRQAQHSLSAVLGPLYECFVQCRTRIAAIEEHYLVSTEEELDELKEDILEADLDDELSSVSAMGRLNLSASLSCLVNMLSQTTPKLLILWQGGCDATAETAGLLEECRLLCMYLSYLLTDDNKGETPAIPGAVLIACAENNALAAEVAVAVDALFKLAEAHSNKIAENPNNRCLSPILAQSFFWFLYRWAPAYIFPQDYGSVNSSNLIICEWSNPQKAQQIISFCAYLSLQHQCYWPQEKQLQYLSNQLMTSLAKRSTQVRSLIVASPFFQQTVLLHCLTAGMRHGASHEEFVAVVRAKTGDNNIPSMNMVWGYQRLPYDEKAQILTLILLACSDKTNAAANPMINDALKVVLEAFTSLTQALASNTVDREDANAVEMTCLCVELFRGVAHASEMSEPDRIPQFVTPYLAQLADLIRFYSNNQIVTDSVLRFFRDYSENFIAVLNHEQSMALFNAVAEMIKNYASNQSTPRPIHKTSSTAANAEEERAYDDIRCVIQLLINLGAKDFIDACSSEDGVKSSQVTDMIFFGLQQILPLVTQGLLNFPTLCTQFFELLFVMMDTYPHKVCTLPHGLFDSLLETLLFGMKHNDTNVAKNSLDGISSIAKEHLKTNILQPHLTQHPDLLDKCSKRLLSEVVFQNVVMDRVDAAGLAMLHLVAIDLNRFANVMQELLGQTIDDQQRNRLLAAFQKLIPKEGLTKAGDRGYEGRMVRTRFKASFAEFVAEVHAFLVLK